MFGGTDMTCKPPAGSGRFEKLVARTRRDTPRPPAVVRKVDSVEQFGRRSVPAAGVEILTESDRLIAIMAPAIARSAMMALGIAPGAQLEPADRDAVGSECGRE
jgi:hypothetical protein